MKIIYLSLVMLLFAVCSCNQNKNASEQIVKIENLKEYLSKQSFRSSSGLESINKNIEFWEKKLKSGPSSMTWNAQLAGAYTKKFGITKNSDDLKRADSLYSRVLHLPGGYTAENLQAVSRLSVTKHQFTKAQEYALQALEQGSNRAASYQLLFDVLMERGDYELARQNLSRLNNQKSFSYLIRLSKYKDYEGKLDSAIHYLEKAADRIGHDRTLRAWTLSNLGDMYGHANRVVDSYASYLNVLQEEQTGTSYLHSLKGMAWIAYAHDNNPEVAERILSFVDSQIHSPDIKPMLAELAGYRNQEKQKENIIRAFVKEAEKPQYFGMYDTYLIEFAATEKNDYDRAMQLVSEELKDRPNPLIFNLKALTYLQQGEMRKALEVVEQNVEGRTHEPVPVVNMAKIYKANGRQQEARKYFEEALGAGYEIGPVSVREIREELKSL